jgi:hypothetical protein
MARIPRKTTGRALRRALEPEAESQPEPRRGVEFVVGPSERPTFYSNNTQVRMSLYDAVLDLGVAEVGSPGRLVVHQTARVIMSIPHVKKLADLLNRQLAEYEQQHGPIPTSERGSSG